MTGSRAGTAVRGATARGTVSSTGHTTFANLVVNGTPIDASPAPNTKIQVDGIGTIVLNEQNCGNGSLASCSASGGEHLSVTSGIAVPANRSATLFTVGPGPAIAALGLSTLLLSSCHATLTDRSGSALTPASTAPSPTASLPAIRSMKKVLPSIEHFVERERGLRFKHPVKAKVLGDKPFLKQLHKGEKKPKPKQVERLLSTLSSLGLVAPTTPIVKAFRTATDDGTLGFYDFKTKRLYVRGSAATPGVRAVLSHELTHALTDQWFGLSRPKLQHANDERGDAFTALSEGDAERTRMAYEARELTPAEQQAAKQEEQGSGSFPHVPRVVLELIGFPYAVGPQFVRALVTHGGIAALNHAYKHPPVSSEQLINPAAYFAHDEPKHVAVPKADGVKVDHGELGYVGFLLMLENGLDITTAQEGVFGWGGDRYSTWRVGKGAHHWCLRDSVVMDDAPSTTRFDQALAQWVATRDGKAHVEHTGKTTTFVTCSA